MSHGFSQDVGSCLLIDCWLPYCADTKHAHSCSYGPPWTSVAETRLFMIHKPNPYSLADECDMFLPLGSCARRFVRNQAVRRHIPEKLVLFTQYNGNPVYAIG